VCRIAELEKDLYYYKMTSREFKKKLRSSVKSEHEDRDISTGAAVASRGAGDATASSHGMSKLFSLSFDVIIYSQVLKHGICFSAE